MGELNRPPHLGPFGEFTIPALDKDREEVKMMRMPLGADPPELTLTTSQGGELRLGLGRVDMEIRWMAWLDDTDTLHIWRSWTSFEIYRARFERRANRLSLVELFVESSPDRYEAGEGAAHGRQFTETLNHCLSLIMPATHG